MIYSMCVKQTFKHYKKAYFEDDFSRQNRLLEIQYEELDDRLNKDKKGAVKVPSPKHSKKKPCNHQLKRLPNVCISLSKLDPASIYKGKKYISQFEKFFDSPFSDDKRFVVHYFAQLSRDKIHYCKDLVDKLFYEKIFDLINS